MDQLIPFSVRAILDDPPLTRGEDEAAYQRLVVQLGVESGAATAIDWLLVKDVADLTWQIARLRRWVKAYAASKERAGLAHGVFPLLVHRVDGAYDTARALADDLYKDAGGGDYREIMARHGVPAQHVGTAYAFFDNLKSFAQAERMLMELEHRRDRVIVRIDARRAAFASALRAAANRVVEGEVATIAGAGSPPLAPALVAAVDAS
jgi:hypothetical protein